jgi:hypothetical protein
VEEHSHAGMANRYVAGASGLPFAVLRGYVGTDLPAQTESIKPITCPFTGEVLTAVPALRPIRLLRAAPLVSRVEEEAVERLIDRCAGLDVHKASVTATVRVPGEQGGRRAETRTFRATTAGLVLLGDWLASFGVTVVGMESTGVSGSRCRTCWRTTSRYGYSTPSTSSTSLAARHPLCQAAAAAAASSASRWAARCLAGS